VELKQSQKRILEIAKKHNLSHLGSYYSALPILEKIYSEMTDEDIFILSSGHAAVALYVTLEKHKGINAETLFEKHGGHPHYNEQDELYCSTGSLGLGLLVAIGRALADRSRKVYCLISDGECAEGSIWEGLRFIHEENIPNIEVYVNMNGYAAYDAVDVDYLSSRLKSFLPRIKIIHTEVNAFPFLRGLNAHYHIMSEEDYKHALKTLTEGERK
jgi:transketolase